MALVPVYTSVLTDLQGVVLGDLVGATATKVALPHLRVPTASFQLPLWHRRASDLLTKECLIKVYRRDFEGSSNNRLIFNGPVLSVEENGDALKQSIAVTATGPFWRFSKRLLGKSKAGIQFGTEASPLDLATIAKQAIDTTNGEHYTGIEPTAQTDDPGIANGSTGQLWLKNVAELIAELSAGLNSFDWVVTPTEPTNVGKAWPQIGTFTTAPLIGVQRPNAIFEYGTPRANVSGYTRSLSREGILNQAVLSVQGWPDATARELVIRPDAASITARGLFEEQVSEGGVFDDSVRALIGDEHLRYRKQPREIVTFTPAINASPAPFLHYEVGDWVRARAVVNDVARFDAMFRVWGLTLSLDNNGSETVEMQLVAE